MRNEISYTAKFPTCEKMADQVKIQALFNEYLDIIFKHQKKYLQRWRYSSVIEHLFSMCNALGSISSTPKNTIGGYGGPHL